MVVIAPDPESGGRGTVRLRAGDSHWREHLPGRVQYRGPRKEKPPSGYCHQAVLVTTRL